MEICACSSGIFKNLSLNILPREKQLLTLTQRGGVVLGAVDVQMDVIVMHVICKAKGERRGESC